MSYSLSDFKTRKKIDTSAKKELFSMIVERTFGGIECAKNAYESKIKSGTWRSHSIGGMCSYLDELTGGDYGTDNPALQTVAGTLATQFKIRFPEVIYLVSNMPCTSLNEGFSGSNIKKEKKGEISNEVTNNLDYGKLYSVLSEIHSKKLNRNEMQFISENLVR